MFEKFVNRYVIEGDLTTATAIHIGAAENEFKPGSCQNPFFRNAKGLPLIPGSSLKGAMRSFLEMYLSTEAGRNAVLKEVHYREEICNEQEPCVDAKRDEELKNLLKSTKQNAQIRLSEYLFGVKGDKDKKGKLCIICRLFGSHYSAAKFSVRDAVVKEETFENKFEIRSNVAIDRDLGTAAGSMKFETEVVPEGTVFSFRAVLENGDEVEWKSISLLLRAMELGLIPIGGMKSRGLGEVKLEHIKYQYIDEDNIAEYLSGEEIPSKELSEE